ncbi:type VI secretion system protein VasG [Variovorax beijingensis]|uniref:Type VI secretion system protein VasG n=1 Tax=Variovorax beijingensis TaxID=2496117 RepID=A0A561CGY0_9BURK|nr:MULTISPECIES: type VI secretion system ATPase TssH [Variovorax]MBD9668760.1 type VI secretion system ATPase TssH [Variovorax sp. VRV01]MDP9963929.1 type VI secretion system protein VasG [Variovorax paradoxus]MDR6453422.1 type VI secretion system protein VasG [Variovorax paradoxus]TWD90354.1 type VI secretion system protein VasG [Variovorax beijingensis]
MTDIRRVSLFSKLNPMLYKALETATAFAKLRGNAYVELVHWLHQILQLQDSDLLRIVRRAGLNLDAVEQDLVRALDRLPHGATSISDISEHVDNAVERAWVYASLRFEATSIRGAYLLAGIVKTPGLRQVLSGISREFDKIVPDVLIAQLPAWTEGSPEDDFDAAAAPGPAAAAASHQGDGAAAGGSALAKYASDLTAKARAGELDPVYGRDDEIRQIIDILMRRRQNNPLLTGEAGVGKTAVVEGLASRLAAGDVPPSLKDVSLWVLDPTLLQAGAGVKGEFEQRLRQVIDEVEKSPKPIVLFVDEVHTLVGAGGTAGTGDAANLLKPALARGRLRTIGATTWSEYKKYIEKDPALTRRFQTIQVHEPTESKAVVMLRGISAELEKHHGVLILDAALEAAVSLSHRYIPARQLPDKAVSLLDTACARVALSQHALPAAIEDLQRRIEVLGIESGIAGREAAIGVGEHRRVEDIAAQVAAAQAELDLLEQRRAEESLLVERIVALRKQLSPAAVPVQAETQEQGDAADEDAPLDAEAAAPEPGRTPEEIRAELDQAQDRLVQLQGESPLILAAVDAQAIATVVADWTGIPIGRMVRDDAQSVLRLGEILSARVVAQPDALETISRRIRTARARLDNPNKPVGVFLLCGPSGVGKTETALALSEALYGGEQNLVTINMSEFQESHTVSTLKGAPPGYVGYGEGGVLTEAVRRRPYSVVLLDEIEKAHPDVHEIFFQVFDKGWMEDGEGRHIDFRNTVIIMTSNVGTDLVMQLCEDPTLRPDPEPLAAALREPLLKVFAPALLGRLVVVPYYPLQADALHRIIRLQLDRIATRLDANHGIALDYDDSAVELVARRCTAIESGGRMIDAILTHTILPRLSEEVIGATVSARKLAGVRLSAANDDFHYEFSER